MKKIRAIFTLTLLILMVAAVSAAGVFAADGKLELLDSYPKDGSTGASIENLGVKLYFDGDMSEEKAGKANSDNVFQLYDSDGKAMPTIVLYNSSEQGVVLVLLDTNAEDTPTVASNSDYTLKISGELVDDNGNQLGQDQEITFKTLNQTTNTIISVVMMVGMFVIMMVATSKAAKKNAEEEKKKQDKVNPYKEAKKTGKSVEEIVEKDQKRKAKEAEKAARKAAEEDEDSENFRVKRRHSASEAGSRYVAERRAAAEEARAKAEALEAKRKAAARKKKKK